MDPLLRLQILADSGFPTGAFAHSNGLEYAIAEGWVTDRETLLDFTTDVFAHSWLSLDAPAILCAYHRTESASLITENAVIAAMRPTAEQRAGQAQVGRSFLKICAESFRDLSVLDEMHLALRSEASRNHDLIQFPLAWGWVASQMGIESTSAVKVFVLMAARQWAQVAIRLVPLGQTDAYLFLAGMEEMIHRSNIGALVPGEYRSTSPGYDLAAAGHSGMKARYFRS